MTTPAGQPKEGDYQVKEDLWGVIWIEVYSMRQWHRVPLVPEVRAAIINQVLILLGDDVRAALLALEEPRNG
jgi:hypothetical protein